jgi:hypothetical protein
MLRVLDGQPAADTAQGDLSAIQGAEMAWEETSPWEQFGVGIAKPVRQAYLGGKDLFTDLSDEERRELLRLEQAKSGYATAGEVAGDIAALAIPGGAVGAATKGISRALPRALAALGLESGAVGAYEGLKAPEEGETRLENAATSAALTGAGGVLTKTLGKMGRAAYGKISPTAKKMLDQGVKLTPGQAREGGITSGMEKALMDTPFVGPAVKKMQDTANAQWNTRVLQSVAPKGYEVTAPGREGFKQLQEGFKNAYDRLWKPIKVTDVNLAELGKNWAHAGKNLDMLPPDLKNPLTAVYSRAGQQIKSYMDSGDVGLLSKLDDDLRDAILDTDRISARHLRSFRSSLREALPPEAASKLTAIDKKYADYAVAQKAASYVKSLENDSIINHRQLQTAIKNKSGERQLVTGEGRLQPFADEAEATLGRVSPQRSQINIGEPVSRLAATGAGIARPIVTGTVLGGARGLINEPMRKALTSPVSPQFRTRGQDLARLLRMEAGAYDYEE